MRITGGEFLGRTIRPPRGPQTRTTMDQVRQALFNLAGERVKGARALDLFAGSGALGIEALSRGASHVTWVDSSIFCVRAIEANLKSLSLTAEIGRRSDCEPPSKAGWLDSGRLPFAVLRSDALAAIRRLAREHRLFDLVLLDPPYGTDLARIALNALAQHAIVDRSGWVVVEHDKRLAAASLRPEPSGCFLEVKSKRYGDTVLTIYERQ